MTSRVVLHEYLEEVADAMLKQSLEGVFSHKAKSDILTPWKQADRWRREIPVSHVGRHEQDGGPRTGASPERHHRQGMFHRVTNRSRPDLNSRDGWASFARYRNAKANALAWDAGATTTRLSRGLLSVSAITYEEFKRGEEMSNNTSPSADLAPEHKICYNGGSANGEHSTVLDVQTLRELFRQLQQWHSIYESDQVDTITGPGGEQICLWDIDYLYSQLHRLPKRQREAIELYLVQNMREADAAVAMGVSATNPIGIYATVGLEKLVKMIDGGELPRFGQEKEAVA